LCFCGVISALYFASGWVEAKVATFSWPAAILPFYKTMVVVDSSPIPIVSPFRSSPMPKKVVIATPPVVQKTVPYSVMASPSSTSVNATVARVVDGDTIDVQDSAGQTSRVRLIGINAPESVDPKTKVQCYGEQSAVDATALLLGQSVRLEVDSTQGDKDIYGRLLRYVYLQNGTLANDYFITHGDAKEYTYKTSYQKQALFKQDQALAKASQAGLWSPQTCNGKIT